LTEIRTGPDQGRNDEGKFLPGVSGNPAGRPDVVFRDDFAVGYSTAIAAAVGCPLAEFLRWRPLKPYRASYESALAGFQDYPQPVP
jgi:hypothetical protein